MPSQEPAVDVGDDVDLPSEGGKRRSRAAAPAPRTLSRSFLPGQGLWCNHSLQGWGRPLQSKGGRAACLGAHIYAAAHGSQGGGWVPSLATSGVLGALVQWPPQIHVSGKVCRASIA